MNIPPDLFRALAAVVDQRSFTRAAGLLGLSQPAVSAQIKRLEDVLGTELFDRSAPGVLLTRNGTEVLAKGRRLLSLHDEIVDEYVKGRVSRVVRIGVPDSDTGAKLAPVHAALRDTHKALLFDVSIDICPSLMKGLENGALDLCIASTDAPEPAPLHRTWAERVTWMAAPDWKLARDGTIDLVCRPEGCVYRGAMLDALDRAGLAHRITCVSQTVEGVIGMVRMGLGLSLLGERLVPPELRSAADLALLPQQAAIAWGVYGRETSDRLLGDVAQRLGQMLDTGLAGRPNGSG